MNKMYSQPQPQTCARLHSVFQGNPWIVYKNTEPKYLGYHLKGSLH